MKKERADDLLVQQGWADNREKAKRLIMSGKAYTIKEEKLFTAGEKWAYDTSVYIKGAEQRYVSRGGKKLEKAIDHFKIDLKNKIVLDIGASTGGFTDVSLQNGAQLVYALDVGTNQLAWTLRTHPKVVVMEQTNFRQAKPDDFKEEKPDIATIDVSFISLKLIFPVLKTILKEGGEVVALIKPQFEARKEEVGVGGIISDDSVHKDVVQKIVRFVFNEGFYVNDIIPSPIKGGKGNKEFLAYISHQKPPGINETEQLNHVMKDSLFE